MRAGSSRRIMKGTVLEQRVSTGYVAILCLKKELLPLGYSFAPSTVCCSVVRCCRLRLGICSWREGPPGWPRLCLCWVTVFCFRWGWRSSRVATGE